VPEDPALPTTGTALLKKIFSAAIDNTGSVIGVAIVSCAVYFWGDIKSEFDSHIISEVENDLTLNDNSRLLKDIRTTISSDIKSSKGPLFDSVDSTYHNSLNKVFGEIVYGSLNLGNLKSSTKMQFFVPPKHKGVLRMQVENLPPNMGIRVVAEESGSWGIVCESTPVVYPLDNCLWRGRKTRRAI
jgi:hypothetical protein